MKKSPTLLVLITIFLLASCATPTPVAPTATAEPSAIATMTIPPTFTPTAIPMLTVNQTAECRTGPGPDYDLVSMLDAGQQVEVIGRDGSRLFWAVKDGEGRICWADGQFVSLPVEQADLLPEFTPPPVPTPAPPAAPSDLAATYTCEVSQRPAYGKNKTKQNVSVLDITITLTWKDNADNELGYQIFNGGEGYAVLPASTTKFVDTITYSHISVSFAFKYGVQAYNDAGKSSIIEIEVGASCQ